MLFGVSLVVVGVILLLQNLGLVAGDAWGIILPSLIIILGISILAKKDRRESFSEPKQEKKDK